jgi:hypothetical protein
VALDDVGRLTEIYRRVLEGFFAGAAAAAAP